MTGRIRGLRRLLAYVAWVLIIGSVSAAILSSALTGGHGATAAATPRYGGQAIPLSAFQRYRGVDPSTHIHRPPGSIVGSETPDLIPLEVAVGAMLRTLGGLADSPNAPPRALAAYWRRIDRRSGFSMSQSDLDAIVASGREYVVTTRAMIRTPSEEPGRVAMQQWEELRNTLSPTSFGALERFVTEDVVTHITILK